MFSCAFTSTGFRLLPHRRLHIEPTCRTPPNTRWRCVSFSAVQGFFLQHGAPWSNSYMSRSVGTAAIYLCSQLENEELGGAVNTDEEKHATKQTNHICPGLHGHHGQHLKVQRSLRGELRQKWCIHHASCPSCTPVGELLQSGIWNCRFIHSFHTWISNHRIRTLIPLWIFGMC